MDHTTYISPTHPQRVGFPVFSVWDTCCASMVIKGAWLYANPLDVALLQEGLSQLLDFYPFFGSVPFTLNDRRQQSKDASVQELLTGDAQRRERLLEDFSPKYRLASYLSAKKPVRNASAPLSICLTQLKDGSLLTVHCAHLFMDGASFYRMVQQWAALCRGERLADTPKEPLCITDRQWAPAGSTLTREQTQQAAHNAGWVHLTAGKLLRMGTQLAFNGHPAYREVLHVNNTTLEQLKEQYAQAFGSPAGTHALLSAYVIKQLAKGYPAGKHIDLVTVTNLRHRWNRLPNAYVGNAVANLVVKDLNPANSLLSLAHQIKEGNALFLANDNGCLDQEVALSVNAFCHKLPYVAFDVAAMQGKHPQTLYINNLLSFHPDRVDFGTGLPVLSVPNNLPDKIKFWPATDKDGVDIYIRS